MKRVLVAFAVGLVVAGCGGGNDEASPTDTGTTTAPAETTQIRVYWLRDGKVWPALREVEETEAIATAALEQLLAGPTVQEKADLDFSTAIPEGTEVDSIEIEDGIARVQLSAELPDEPLAQVVYTLTQFPTV